MSVEQTPEIWNLGNLPLSCMNSKDICPGVDWVFLLLVRVCIADVTAGGFAYFIGAGWFCFIRTVSIKKKPLPSSSSQVRASMLSWLEPGDFSVCRAGGALEPQVQLLTLHLSAQDWRLKILGMSGLRKSGLLCIISPLTKNFADFLSLLGEPRGWRALARAPHHDGH